MKEHLCHPERRSVQSSSREHIRPRHRRGPQCKHTRLRHWLGLQCKYVRLRHRRRPQCRRFLRTLLKRQGFQQLFSRGQIRRNGLGPFLRLGKQEALDCRSLRSLSVGAPGTHKARFRGVVVRGFSVEVSTSFVATYVPTTATMLLLRRGFKVPRLTLMDYGAVVYCGKYGYAEVQEKVGFSGPGLGLTPLRPSWRGEKDRNGSIL